jgi:hypothetical protein
LSPKRKKGERLATDEWEGPVDEKRAQKAQSLQIMLMSQNQKCHITTRKSAVAVLDPYNSSSCP